MAKRAESGSVHVDSRVLDPGALAYKRQVEERFGNSYNEPRGGGPTPPIPRLDMPAADGLTMADQARSQMPPPGPAVQQASSFITRPPTEVVNRPVGPGGPPPKAMGPQLLPGDLLPEAAKSDPNFQAGQGSMYAVSQPALALKYGVIRNNQHLVPQQITGASKGGLKPETVRDLEQLQQLQQIQQTRKEAESASTAERDAAVAGPAGAAARLGGGDKPVTDADREGMKKALEAIDKIDDFDFNTFREMTMKDILNNEEQKKLIESRLEPMDLGSYVMEGSVRQRVPINSKLTYEFRSMDAATDLALKRLIVKEAKGMDVNDRYILDKYSIMSMTCAIYKINDIPLPDYLDKDGHFNDELFWEKFNKVTRMGFHILASIGINAFWFDIRVRKLIQAESLGNG